jgi:hypothetical protein
VKVVREDPFNTSVLYAGTEFGLYVTLDRGKIWSKLGGLPTVAVDDLAVHPRERDLVIATHGRSLYVLDDVRPIEELDAMVKARAAHLFPVRAGVARHLLPGFSEWAGASEYRGANPPEGVVLSFWIGEPSYDPAKIEIKNAQGQTVANLQAPALRGIGRTSWDLKPTKDVLTEYGSEGALHLRAGTYEATLTVGSATSKQSFEVKTAPGVETR